MKNARQYLKEISESYPFANYVATGVKKSKKLDDEQRRVVAEMLSAAKATSEVRNLKGFEETILCMQLMTFINTL